MRVTPKPPMPDIIGSTTLSVAATATAASKALPPASKTSSPAWVASGCAVLIIPCLPTAGREAVLRFSGLLGGAPARLTVNKRPPINNTPGTHLFILDSLLIREPYFDVGTSFISASQERERFCHSSHIGPL